MTVSHLERAAFLVRGAYCYRPSMLDPVAHDANPRPMDSDADIEALSEWMNDPALYGAMVNDIIAFAAEVEIQHQQSFREPVNRKALETNLRQALSFGLTRLEWTVEGMTGLYRILSSGLVSSSSVGLRDFNRADNQLLGHVDMRPESGGRGKFPSDFAHTELQRLIDAGASLAVAPSVQRFFLLTRLIYLSPFPELNRALASIIYILPELQAKIMPYFLEYPAAKPFNAALRDLFERHSDYQLYRLFCASERPNHSRRVIAAMRKLVSRR